MTEPQSPSSSRDAVGDERLEVTWRTARRNVVLFVLTVLSVLVTQGWEFTVALMLILLTHEFGHYFAARYHRVPASLPFFIPLPFLGFGTLGAVIAMPGRIRSRSALLDIGASGPLAGLVVALPLLFWGIAHSPVSPSEPPYVQEGQSIIYLLVKWLVHGSIAPGHDVQLHPVAFAGWAGLLVTMINLLPFGQLDGGHIAYALFGERQNRFALWFRRALLQLFVYNVAVNGAPMLLGTEQLDAVQVLNNSMFWLVWYFVLGLLARFSGGTDHPPCGPGALSPGRRRIAWLSLALFFGLFMPTPIAVYP
jgi:membrane-associated protease RseP (regulator of RpoE activity)